MFNLRQGKNVLFLGLFVLMAFSVLFTTCDVGLGNRVNTDRPVIGTGDGDSSPGSFLQSHKCTGSCPSNCELEGKNRLIMDVQQPFGLEEVYMLVTYRIENTDGSIELIENERFDAIYDPNNDEWYIDLPTSEWADGRVTAVVVAVDKSGNTTTTTDMIYTIKNSAPQIELSIPRIRGTQFDRPDVNAILTQDTIYQGTDLMGTALDVKGIAIGYPKIMIWPAEENGEYNVNIDPITKMPIDAQGNRLDTQWGNWHTVVNSQWNPVNQNENDPETALPFRWPLVELKADGSLPKDEFDTDPSSIKLLEPGIYNIMIKIKDTFEPNPNENSYPNRVENPNFTPEDNPIQFMQILISSSTSPIIRIQRVPSYYNPDNPFSGTITTANISGSFSIFTRFSHTATMPTDIENFPLGGTPPADPDFPGSMVISLTSAQVKNQLNNTNLSGEKHWHIRIKTLSGDIAEISRPVVFDNEKPYMRFTQPLALITGGTPTVFSTVHVRGSALDNQLVDRMYYVLGRTETQNVVTQGSSTDNNNFNGWRDSQLGRTCIFDDPIPANNCPSRESCTNPAHFPLENHANTGLTGWFNVNTRFEREGILPAWTWTFDDVVEFCTGANNYYVTRNAEFGGNRWDLPIWYKIIDKAGNVSVVQTTLILDPDRDLPTVEIASPAAGSTVGGSVRVNGMAMDNEVVHSIEARISRRNLTTGALINYEYSSGPSDDSWIDITTLPRLNGRVGERGSAVSWNFTINEERELDPPIGTGLQRVLIEVRARDAFASTPDDVKPTAGLIDSRTIFISPDVPIIDDKPLIIHGNWNDTIKTEIYEPGSNKIKDKITLRVPFESTADIESIAVRVAGTWSANLFGNRLPNTGSDTLTNSFVQVVSQTPERNQYVIYIPIDTNTINNGAFNWQNGNPGNLILDVEAIDNTVNKFTTRKTYTIQVDNQYPFASLDSLLTAQGDFEIFGKAWDSADRPAIVQGIERIVVYFARDDGANGGLGNPIYLSGPQRGQNAAGAQFPVSAFNARRNRTATTPTLEHPSEIINAGTTRAQLPFFPDVGASFTTNNNGIVIDNDALDRGEPVGFRGGQIKDWEVTYDSTQLRDGKYILHYVVFDDAGNATHYHTPIYIANNRPIIERIELGTNNGGGTIDFTNHPINGTDYMFTESDPYFRVQNNRFDLNIVTSSGNFTPNVDTTSKRYRVYYATRGTARVTSITAGEVYTIMNPGAVRAREAPVNTPKEIEWFNFGAPKHENVRANYAGVTFVATKNILAENLPADVDVRGYTRLASPGDVQTLADGIFTGAVGDVVNNIGFGTSTTRPNSFGTTAATIQDSPGVRIDDDTGKIEWNKTGTAARYFIVHVYDAVHGTFANTPAYRADQLSHVALINIGVTNGDSLSPLMEVANIGRHYVLREPLDASHDPTLRNYRDRVTAGVPDSLYNLNVVTTEFDTVNRVGTGTRKGYVQYAADNTRPTVGGRADTSGMVIFRGKAMDNNRIARISVAIPGYTPPQALVVSGTTSAGAEFYIASLNTAGTALEPGFGTTRDFTMATMRSSADQHWAFEATDISSSGEFGNVLYWNFAFDTSRISTVIADNVTIRFRTMDAANNWSAATSAVSAVTSNFNVVPYIKEVVTPISAGFRSNPSAFNRSATGWYPVRENDDITINGFNLPTDATVYLNGTSLALSATGRTTRQISANIGETAASGALEIRNAAGTAVISINNNNHATVHYNQEPNNLNNNGLSDDRYMYVWRVGTFHDYGVTVPATRQEFPYLNPIMRMDSQSRWYMAYGGAATSGTGSPTAAFQISGGVNTGALYVASSNSATPTVPYRTQNRMRHTTVAFDSFGNAYTIGANQTAGADDWRFANTIGGFGSWTWRTQNTQTLPVAEGDRYQLPRIATQSTGGTAPTATNPVRVLLSYFDNLDNTASGNQLRLHFGANTGATAAAALNDPQVVARNGSTHEGSMFTAVGFMTTGRPVIAWYDRTNMNLVLSYGGAVPATTDTSLVTPTGERVNGRLYNTSTAHNLTVGQPVLIGTTQTTIASVPTATSFALVGTFNESITVTPGIRPTATSRTGTGAATRVYTFAAGHGFVNNSNEEVRFSNNGTLSTAYVRGVATNNVGFSTTSGGAINIEFANNTTHWTQIIAYRPGRNITTSSSTQFFDNIPGTWQGNAKIVQSLAGSHVDMVIDTNNIVHLAYYDVLNGGLWYARIPVTGTDDNRVPDVDNAVKVKVDTYLSAGTRIMLNVRDNVPYISYYHGSFDETRNSIRVAWQVKFPLEAGSDEHDRLTGAWEIMTVPPRNVPASGQLVTHGVPSTGTLANTVGLQGWNGNDITKTMIVAYMTSHDYEGAILKHDITTAP